MVLIVLMEQALLLVEVGVDDGDEERVVETDRSNGADRDPNTAAPSWWRRFVVGAAASVSLSQEGPFEWRMRMRVDGRGVGGRWCWGVVDGRRLMCSLSGSSSRCCCWRAMMRVGEPSNSRPADFKSWPELLERLHASRCTRKSWGATCCNAVDIFCCIIAIAVRML